VLQDGKLAHNGNQCGGGSYGLGLAFSFCASNEGNCRSTCIEGLNFELENAGLAGEALDQLSGWTQAGGTDWGLGVEARCRALLSDGEAADCLYQEAIDRLGRTRLRPELARAHLLYGEWLRREGRRADARAQLRTAHEMFAAIGMLAFAERARRELQAAGETVRKRTGGTHGQLTPQEAQIARLARSGLSNPQIAAQLFLSPRTVQYHLAKVFSKLEISSRRELERALPDGASAAPSG